MTQIKYWLFISTLSIVLSNDGEGYRFIGNSTQDYYVDLESIFEMSFGPWEFFMNYSIEIRIRLSYSTFVYRSHFGSRTTK